MRNEVLITFCGQTAKVACDRKCGKAWGRNCRPRMYLTDDEDDWEYLADGELGTAPNDPGTTEGDDRKPRSPDGFPNKWCVRECERCRMSRPGEWTFPVVLRDFSTRVRDKKGT